ncbi:helix-turn-helix domain-containing protein [Viridibacillus arvi]|uniref:helix-turn-helix domain-containing protein n=1 Tax=Viridibacillus arvi TaxID=263475 RepID=UPI003D07881B
MSNFLKLVGNELRKIRIKQGLTLEELANKTDLDYSYLGKIERGDQNITLLTLEKIIDALNISLITLFNLNEVSENNDSFLNQILEQHERMLKNRSKKEVETIHNIFLEIFSLLDVENK